MIKTVLTIGLNDKITEKQEIATADAKRIISDILINRFNVFAFTMFDVSGVYKMNSSGNIVQENSLRVEIVNEFSEYYNENLEKKYLSIINLIKSALNQESVMMETGAANVNFI